MGKSPNDLREKPKRARSSTTRLGLEAFWSPLKCWLGRVVVPVYLPIAELEVSALALLAIGGGVGILSGIFGVGGGFLSTPLLLFYGIPPAVAVATEANQIAAASLSGALAHRRRRSVDVRMAATLTAGGLVGATIGALVFRSLRDAGLAEPVIAIGYVVLLGSLGVMMLTESLRTIIMARRGTPIPFRRPGHHHSWIHRLPLKARFPRSALYSSVIPPLVLGALVGLLATILGVGGGFLLIPAMVYVLKIPTHVVVGTSLLQIACVTAVATVLHATLTGSVDIVLGLILIVSGAAGAQLGARLSDILPAERLRILLALMILLVAIRFAWSLLIQPLALYSVEIAPWTSQ